jgi:hypothetical protein
MTRSLLLAGLALLAFGSLAQARGEERLLARSEYVNLVLRTQTVDGRPVCVVAGVHSDAFPYYHPRSQFDNILLLVGKEAFGASIGAERRSPGQGKDFSLRVTPGKRALKLRFRGRLRHAGSGQRVPVSLDLRCALTWTPEVRFGLKAAGAWVPGSLKAGMVLRPAIVRPDPKGVGALSLAGSFAALRVNRVIGHVEHSTLDNFRSSKFGVTYDYVAVASSPRAPGGAYSYVVAQGKALRSDSTLSHFLGKYLASDPASKITGHLRQGVAKRIDGNHFKVDPKPVSVLISERVDLGMALLDRNLCSFRGQDAQGRPVTLYGLQEVFHPVTRGVLEGRVLDALTKKPVRGAQVYFKDRVPLSRTDPAGRSLDLGAVKVVTDAEGRFSLELPMDMYRVVVRAAGYAPATLSQAFPAAGEQLVLVSRAGSEGGTKQGMAHRLR